MKCEDIGILISAYVDGEVTEEEKQFVETHLCDCTACRETLNEFVTLHTLSQGLEVKEALPGFRQRVTQRIDDKSRVVSLWWRLPRLVYAVSLALLLVISGTIIGLHMWQDQVPLDVDVYAEDILFNQSTSVGESLFFEGYEASIAEEILDTIDFTESDTSALDEDSMTS